MFLSLGEYAAKNNVVRQTASDRLNRGGCPFIKSGSNYYIPDTAEYMMKLVEHRNKLISEGAENLGCIVISFVNHKGGVGKSIASVNVAASLAFNMRAKVLLIDADPQSNTSKVGGLRKKYNNFKENNILKLLNELDQYEPGSDGLRDAVRSAIVNVDVMNEICPFGGKLDLLPNSLDWADMVEPLIFKANSANYLDILLEPIKADYDFIIIDTGPNLDVLWRQAVVASDTLLIATKLEEDSVDGLIGVCRKTYKLNTIYRDRKKRNIEILGAVVLDVQKNVNYTKDQSEDLHRIMKNDLMYNSEPGIVFEPNIARSVKASEIQVKSRIALIDAPTSSISDEFLRLSAAIAYHVYKRRGV